MSLQLHLSESRGSPCGPFAMSLLEDARNAKTEFSEIPIMSVSPSRIQLTLTAL